jgi:hypothetical protein
MPTAPGQLAQTFVAWRARLRASAPLTHRSPGQTPRRGSLQDANRLNFLFNGWTISSFTPLRAGYLIVQTAVRRTLPNNIISTPRF